jgi:CubicO group peptidase (beta-lactamase class C family)
MIKFKVSVHIILLLVIAVGCSQQSSYQSENKKRIAAIDSLIQHEIEADHISGAVLQVKKGNTMLHRGAYGFAQEYNYSQEPLENPEPMTLEHLFDLASLTKVCATTFGIMKLVDEGTVALDDPIGKYLPAFTNGDKSRITVRHLLTHSSGLPQWVPTYYHASNREQRYEFIAGLPLKWPVGEGRHYSDLGFMLLGDIIERVTNKRMDKFVAENIYQPLHLKHTTFNPLDNGFSKIAATSHGNPFEKQMVYDDDFGYTVEVDPKTWDSWRQYTLRGEVNDGNAWYANGGVAGHAGLFSTVGDLQVLVDLLLNNGRFEDNQIISSAVIDTFLNKDRYGNGLGWAMDADIISAEGAPSGTFGHTGFTGTNIVAVPSDTLSVILLTNRQHVGRQENGYYFNLGGLRQQILDKVYQRRK